MAVNPKEKKMLQEMWAGAEDASGADMPDGTYQFEIMSARFHMTDKNKPQFKTKLKVVGGGEDYEGKELEINDNLETKENMGWFKRKLRRLNITVSEDFDEIVDGTIAAEMEGKIFEGQVKTKNDFMNVYVNRLVSEASEERPKSKAKAEEAEEKEETEEKEEKNEFSEGDNVTWGDGKEGEIVEILEDDEKARVKLDDDSIVRVKLSLLSKAVAGTKGNDKAKESEDDGEMTLPTPDEVEEMKAPQVRKVLEFLDFDPENIKDPRGVLHSFATLAEDEDAKIELSEVKPLADALDVTVKKGAPMKEVLNALSKAVQERIEE